MDVWSASTRGAYDQHSLNRFAFSHHLPRDTPPAGATAKPRQSIRADAEAIVDVGTLMASGRRDGKRRAGLCVACMQSQYTLCTKKKEFCPCARPALCLPLIVGTSADDTICTRRNCLPPVRQDFLVRASSVQRRLTNFATQHAQRPFLQARKVKVLTWFI